MDNWPRLNIKEGGKIKYKLRVSPDIQDRLQGMKTAPFYCSVKFLCVDWSLICLNMKFKLKLSTFILLQILVSAV